MYDESYFDFDENLNITYEHDYSIYDILDLKCDVDFQNALWFDNYSDAINFTKDKICIINGDKWIIPSQFKGLDFK